MIVYTIIGTLIGAGFASGQEIFLFFYRYGRNGLIGILLCSLLISITIYKSMKIIYIYKINTYSEFLNHISINKKISRIINKIINIFLGSMFCIMISAFGTYFNQEFRY